MRMSPEAFKKFMDDQRQELLKFKWCLGVELHHDPTIDRTEDEIYMEWIMRFSKEFREHWEKENLKDKNFSDLDNIKE